MLSLEFVLGSNEKVVDERGVFNVRARGSMDKSFQSHPIGWVNPNHAHRDPRRTNPADDRQSDVYKGLLAFQP